MVELRIKSDKVDEINDFMRIFRMNLPGYVSLRMSKAYVLRNGDYKFFVECIKADEFHKYKTLEQFAVDTPITPKKRGRKPKGLKLLEDL